MLAYVCGERQWDKLSFGEKHPMAMTRRKLRFAGSNPVQMTAAVRLDTQRQSGKNTFLMEQSENVIENKGSAWRIGEQSENVYENTDG